jgi:hypothetical protein
MVPPGGWHFVDTSTGQSVRIDGDNFKHLASNVLNLRISNGKPAGNPLEEVAEFICGQWPHFCRGGDGEAPPQRGENASHISRRVMVWMNTFLSARLGLVDAKEADRRASVCALCPKNVDHRQSGCASCVQQVERDSFVFRKARVTPSDKKLGACEIIGQHNQTAVHAELLDLPPAVRQELPAHCWRK